MESLNDVLVCYKFPGIVRRRCSCDALRARSLAPYCLLPLPHAATLAQDSIEISSVDLGEAGITIKEVKCVAVLHRCPVIILLCRGAFRPVLSLVFLA